MSPLAGAMQTTGVELRPATPGDAAAIAAVYNQGIAGRAATFDADEVTGAEVAGWLGDARQPVLVAMLGGGVVGWARIIKSKERCALAGVGEYAIYVDGAAQGRGIGAQLLQALLAAAEAAGYWKLQGRLFTSNAASIALARRCGFREVGVYERHGRVDGRWQDLLVVERLLGEAARA